MANLVEGFQSIEWSDYQAASSKGQIASGILVAITVIALAVIFATHPQVAYLKANLTGIITLAATGGIALVTLIACTTLNFYAMRKMDEEKETSESLQQLLGEEPQKLGGKEEEKSSDVPKDGQLLRVDQPIVSKIDIKTDPIGHAKEVLLDPLWEELENLIKIVVAAHGLTMSKNMSGKYAEIKNTFTAGKKLFNSLLENPQIYLTELLGFFGGNKIPIRVLLRRLIAAKNSGDDKKFQEVLKIYEAAQRAYDLSDILELFNSDKSNEQVMQELPRKLENHFCFTDETLKNMGIEVLKQIFDQTKENQEILNHLPDLKKTTKNTEKFREELEKFVKHVFKKANVSQELIKKWNDGLIKYMLKTQFVATTCSLLRVVARNLRILKLLFDKNQKQKKVFTELDTIFLLSESNEFILKKELQEELLKVQSAINQSRDEKDRIALLIVNDKKSLSKSEMTVFNYCTKDTKVQDLKKIETEESVVQLATEYEVNIVAVPISISNHPFKKVIKYETEIRLGTGFAQGLTSLFGKKDALKNYFSEKIAKPRLKLLLPKLEQEDYNQLNNLTEGLINFLFDPIIDGAIKNTKFSFQFKDIIATEGENLAKALENLASQENITFQTIGETGTTAIKNLTNAFIQIIPDKTLIELITLEKLEKLVPPEKFEQLKELKNPKK